MLLTENGDTIGLGVLLVEPAQTTGVHVGGLPQVDRHCPDVVTTVSVGGAPWTPADGRRLARSISCSFGNTKL